MTDRSGSLKILRIPTAFLVAHTFCGSGFATIGVDPAIAALDQEAAFSFAIMSDHKGLSSTDSDRFARMELWIEESGDAFVIGLGDHLKVNRPNTFLDFLENDRWWHEHFYPNVADGENEFYGGSQDSWGMGKPILEHIGLDDRPNVRLGETGCDYYARIRVGEFTVHLIQLHFPDHPRDDKLSFRKVSKRFLADRLKEIEKGPKDIVITAAHSISGFWINELSKEEKNLVADKCDLMLSATTHHFERKKLSEFGDHGALMINTGSVTYPDSDIKDSLPGYVQVHVLEGPLRLDVKYINVDRDSRTMPGGEYAYTKFVGGTTRYTQPE
ncbi:MAG: hypothetical protein DRP71_08235 [Verrucomicrobia bacterium]|nr:MAG: hypothetical protein DRP71_08235 [Verrucomicrobiota bacterium]